MDLLLVLDRLAEGSLQHEEWHDLVLAISVSHRVESAHEPKDRLQFALCNFPVLRVEEEREDTGDIFTTDTDSEFALVLVIESAVSVLVLLEVED